MRGGTTLVAFAGRIGSGKTRLATAVAQRLGAKRASFGGTVRRLAEEGGTSLDRESLQQLGDELIDEGWMPFCALVLDSAALETPVVVLDGVRHRAALAAMAAHSSVQRTVLVFVDASLAARERRVVARGDLTVNGLWHADRQPNESEVDDVRAMADIVVENDDDGVDSLARLVSDICEQLARRGVVRIHPPADLGSVAQSGLPE